jgi:hypothetical protein
MKADPVLRATVALRPYPKIRFWDAPEYRAKLNAHLAQMGDGQDVDVIIRKPRKHRSSHQNAYYWGVVIDILAKHFGYEPEEMHDALLAELWRDHSRTKNGMLSPIKRTSSMSTVEFEDYCARVRRWAVQNYGVRIPEPNEVEL